MFDYATNKFAPVDFRNYITGQPIQGVPTETVSVPEGDYNALFGESYLQVSREGLNQQKSQIGGTGIPAAGAFDSPYHLYASRVAKGPLPAHEGTMFDGIDTTLPAMADYLPTSEAGPVRASLQAIAAQVDRATALFSPQDPAASAPALARGLDLTRALVARLAAQPQDDGHVNALHELRLKEAQFETALNQALGITLLAIAQPAGTSSAIAGMPGPADAASAAAFSPNASTTAIPGQALSVAVHVADQGMEPIRLDAVTLVAHAPGDWKQDGGADLGVLQAGQAQDFRRAATVPADAPLTAPYFSRPTLEQSYYDLQTPDDLTLPTMPYPLSAQVTYSYQVHAKYSDTGGADGPAGEVGAGNRRQPAADCAGNLRPACAARGCGSTDRAYAAARCDAAQLRERPRRRQSHA